MPTLIGLLFGVLGTVCLLVKEEWLLGFVIFAALFSAASVVNFGSLGIQPFYFAACIFIFSEIRKKRFRESAKYFSGKKTLIIFCCIGITSALIYPFVFAGVPIYSPKDGIDDGFFYQPPLQFTLANLAQATYLLVEVVMVLAAASALKTVKIRTLYNYCFGFLVALLVLQFCCLQLGVSFPYSWLRNNPGYSGAEILGSDSRVVGTATEASGVGLILVTFYAGYFYEFFMGTGSVFRVILSAISIGLVRSSSALGAMAVSTGLILALYPAIRFPWYVRRKRFWRLVCVLGAGVLIVLSPLGAILASYTTQKDETLSYVHRTASDLFSLQLAANTHWIGVGLGSNRPSSLIASLLSNVGLAGFLAFVLLLIQIGRNVHGQHVWIRWSLFAGVFDMCLGGPDITQAWLWVVMAMAVYYGTVD